MAKNQEEKDTFELETEDTTPTPSTDAEVDIDLQLGADAEETAAPTSEEKAAEEVKPKKKSTAKSTAAKTAKTAKAAKTAEDKEAIAEKIAIDEADKAVKRTARSKKSAAKAAEEAEPAAEPELEFEQEAEEEPVEEPVESEGELAEEKPVLTRAQRDAERRKRLDDKLKEEAIEPAAIDAKNAFQATWASLRSANNRKLIIRGVISGAHKAEDSDDVICDVLYNNVRISIPFSEYFRKNPLNMENVNLSSKRGREEYVSRQLAFIGKHFGLSIPFIITEMKAGDEHDVQTNYQVKASRAAALKIEEKLYYNARNGKEPILQVGSVADAVVTSVSVHSIAINLGGVDSTIRTANLTYRYLPTPESIENLYKVGQKLKVQIMEIREKSDGTHEISVSPKPVERALAIQKFGTLIVENANAVGVITQIKESRKGGNRIFCKLFLEGYEVPAISYAFPVNQLGHIPSVGDKVKVTVKDFNKAGLVIVSCKGYVSNWVQ